MVTDPQAINTQFASCYESLYSSRVTYYGEELDSYLDQVRFPKLTETDRDRLDSPITIKEIKQALSTLQVGKTPGTEGLPM